MLTKKVKFTFAIIFQVTIILVIIAYKLLVLAGGTEILLKIEPVDPRDLLRGDYINFQYDVSNLDSYFTDNKQIKNGDTVYVVLNKNGKYWVAQEVQKEQPTENKLFIKGVVEKIDSENQYSAPRTHIIYGIEQYFIPEGRGQNFNFTNKEVFSQIVVDSNGNAVLKRVFIDDEPWP